jgi:hypothetical protein
MERITEEGVLILLQLCLRGGHDDRFEVQVEENRADGNRTIKRRTATRQVFQEQAFD